MSRSAAERLRRLWGHFSSEDQVLVVINADPDAIASAMAVKRLLWRRVAGVTIANINVVERPDNLAMIRLLSVKMTHIDQVDLTRFNRFVILDSQPQHHPSFARFSPEVVIDHHPDSGIRSPFSDIRPKYGATATIMTEYLRAARIKPSTKLATGLLHAIKTDTDNFTRQAQMEDIRIFQFLFRHANTSLARKIEQSELKLEYLKHFRTALQTMRIHRNKVFVHLGPVTNPDVCVLIADFFMRVNTVTWSIVSGTCEKILVVILRCDGLRKNAGNKAKRAFANLGPAGGHKSAARAAIGE